MGIEPYVYGLELGGTKCLVLRAEGSCILESALVQTTDPETTLEAVDAILRRWAGERAPEALGIASFGPICVDRDRPEWGRVLKTPKPGWAGTNLAMRYQRLLDVPVGFDTDVNAAALAERRWGDAIGTSCNAYITLGTGVGVGIVVNGTPIHGWMHPEFGHLKARRFGNDDFDGVCPFHGDCIEGLIAGPALAARFGMPGASVPDGHPGWEAVAHDLGALLASLILAVSPQRIALGGSIACSRPWLVARARQAALASLAGYVGGLETAIDTVIDIAALGEQAGPLGAIALSLDALAQR